MFSIVIQVIFKCSPSFPDTVIQLSEEIATIQMMMVITTKAVHPLNSLEDFFFVEFVEEGEL